MTQDAIRWRPLRQSDVEQARIRLGKAIARFQSDWLAHGELAVADAEVFAPRTSVAVEHCIAFANPSCAVLLKEGDTVLLTRVLDFASKRAPTSPADIRLLRQMTTRLSQALGLQVMQAFGSAHPEAFAEAEHIAILQGGLRFELLCGDQAVGEVIVQWRLLEGLDTPKTRSKRTSVTDPATLLEEPTVPLSITVGHAELRLEDLLALQTGDVVVLDRRLEDALECHAGGQDLRLGQTHLYRDGNRLVAQFI